MFAMVTPKERERFGKPVMKKVHLIVLKALVVYFKA